MKRLLPILSVILISGLIYTCTTTPVDPACCKTGVTMQGPGLGHYRFLALANILTTNGDGINDIYYIEVIDTITNTIDTTMAIDFTVFKNANTILFHNANYHNNFTGLDDNGNKIPDGNYKVEVKAPNGTIFSYTLTLTQVKIQDPSCTIKCQCIDPYDPLLAP